MAVVPQNLCRLVQAVVSELLSWVGPMRFTAIANTAVLIEPPKLEAAEGTVLIALDAKNKFGIEQLPYVGSVFDLDLPRCSDSARPMTNRGGGLNRKGYCVSYSPTPIWQKGLPPV